MKKIEVGCWQVESYTVDRSSPDILEITFPSGNNGFDLITCLKCGEVYAVSVAAEVYADPPLKEKLNEVNCKNCGVKLSEGFAYYPDTYVMNGKKYTYKRGYEVPSTDATVIKEFYSIYDD